MLKVWLWVSNETECVETLLKVCSIFVHACVSFKIGHIIVMIFIRSLWFLTGVLMSGRM